jgi:urease gamma subunit
MPGLRFIKAAASFDPEAIRVMGLAYEQACASLDSDDPAARELIAKRIVEAARRGERNVASLAKYGIAQLKRSPGIADAS